MSKPPIKERLARWLAKKANLPLAESTPGAICATNLLPASQSAAEEDTGPERLEAAAKFARWLDIDPFPEIEPSLLNAADIDDYVRATAMVFPYRSAERKTASYPLRVGNEIAYWDPDAPEDLPIRTLADGAAIRIPSNSLVYVRTRELFQLPNYIAVRFNLHIDLVHKGLLLGTGPLVDPGFSGKLMVPLHNLTSNTYVLQVGEDFIWAEFTKTSLIRRWKGRDPGRPLRTGVPVPFEPRKQNKTLADYIDDARRGHRKLQPGLSHRTLQNAVPEKIRQTYDLAENAERSAAAAKRRLSALQATISGLGFLALLGAAYALESTLQSTWASQQATQGLVDTTNERVRDQGARVKELEREVRELKLQMKPPPSHAPKEQGGG
jgi:deoxycytidine triphosphate deaminase